jgi:uncharacterized protein involved in exopolysaccharide biosynthesis
MPLEALLRAVWGRRWLLLLLSLLIYVLGAGLILTWPRRYLAQAVVAPAETTGIGVSSLLASPLNIAAGPFAESRLSGQFAVYLDTLRSTEAAAMLARETALLEHLSALRAEGPLGWLRRGFGLRVEADLDDAVTWLRRNLSVTAGIATVTLTIGLAHRDRAAALDGLRRLHALAETKVRDDVAQTASRRIAAIERRLAQERDLFLRNALYELLGQQQRALVVVAADDAVAARLVSAPMVGIRPVLPNTGLLLLLLAVAAPLAVAGGAACIALLTLPEALPAGGRMAGAE